MGMLEDDLEGMRGGVGEAVGGETPERPRERYAGAGRLEGERIGLTLVMAGEGEERRREDEPERCEEERDEHDPRVDRRLADAERREEPALPEEGREEEERRPESRDPEHGPHHDV